MDAWKNPKQSETMVSMNFFLSQLIVFCNLKQEFHYTGLLLYLIMTIFDSSSPPRNIRKLTSWKMGANTKMKCSSKKQHLSDFKFCKYCTT